MSRGKDAKRHSLLRFELFKKIDKFLSLNLRNILISPFEGEKKFLCELNELRNFREGYTLKYSCRNCNFDRRLYFLKNINCDSDMLHHDKNNKGRLGILAQREAGFEPSPAFVMLTGVRKRLLPLTKREGSDSVISNNYSDTNHSRLTTHYSLISDMVFSRKRTAFTLAEVLITLGIIGIVAVMTLPNVINNFREKQLEAAFKKTNNVVMTALNETMAEYGLEGLAFKDLCPGYTTVSACAQANNSYFNEINSYFLSRFNIVRSTSNTFGNALDRKSIKVYNFMGKKVIEYGGMYGMGAFNTPWNSVNFLNDGSVVSALTFFYHGGSDGVALTFDTNGPYKGPNRFGYDIFIRTSGSWYKPCSKLEAGLEGGNYNGRGCYEYAQKDVNPDDKTKTYWKSLY